MIDPFELAVKFSDSHQAVFMSDAFAAKVSVNGIPITVYLDRSAEKRTFAELVQDCLFQSRGIGSPSSHANSMLDYKATERVNAALQTLTKIFWLYPYAETTSVPAVEIRATSEFDACDLAAKLLRKDRFPSGTLRREDGSIVEIIK